MLITVTVNGKKYTDEIAPHETGSITITLSYEEMETFMKPQNN